MLGDVLRGILGWIKFNQHRIIVVTNNLSCNASSPGRGSAHGKRTATYLDLTPSLTPSSGPDPVTPFR